MFESIKREEWYDMVDTVMQREEGLRRIRKQRNRPFTAYVANEKEQCLEEITFDASHFAKEHRIDVSQFSFSVGKCCKCHQFEISAHNRNKYKFTP